MVYGNLLAHRKQLKLLANTQETKFRMQQKLWRENHGPDGFGKKEMWSTTLLFRSFIYSPGQKVKIRSSKYNKANTRTFMHPGGCIIIVQKHNLDFTTNRHWEIIRVIPSACSSERNSDRE